MDTCLYCKPDATKDARCALTRASARMVREAIWKCAHMTDLLDGIRLMRMHGIGAFWKAHLNAERLASEDHGGLMCLTASGKLEQIP